MSLRYASRVMYQAGKRAFQDMKDQLSNVKALRDSASSSSSKQARRFSGAVDRSACSSINAAKDDRRRQAEESLRTVMYLSCWGPN